jgi:hypothetical protein
LIEYERLSEDNIAYAVGLAKELHGLGTFGQNGPEFDWDFCMSTMQYNMAHKFYYFMLAKLDNEYVGAVCGKVESFFFCSKVMGVEDAWYVRDGTPKRAAIGMKLMHGFMDWCFDTHNAVLVQTGDIAGIRSLAVDTLYRHMGFERFGTVYKYTRK